MVVTALGAASAAGWTVCALVVVLHMIEARRLARCGQVPAPRSFEYQMGFILGRWNHIRSLRRLRTAFIVGATMFTGGASLAVVALVLGASP